MQGREKIGRCPHTSKDPWGKPRGIKGSGRSPSAQFNLTFLNDPIVQWSRSRGKVGRYQI
ncbi:MAG: hypothetical protein CMI15_00790 [Opitutaceae bacterium]|nr:hypothetical protein [Opitutaceae bacterium]